MPPKNAPKERAWGTRYDSLGSWSQSSPPSPENSTLSPSSPSHNKLTSVAHSPTLLHHTPEKQANANIIPNTSEKMPHDASIFVGSLPSHIDHNELTRLLSEHLAGFNEVKSVKVVRDNKGGVCAFVQCQDAQSAASLIETLQSQPPRPFIGRYLRYEPARAFRTLLVSYRAPTQFMRAKTVLHDSPAGAGETQVVALEPASAMRIFRPHQSKYLAITYNDESHVSGGEYTANADITQSTHDPFAGEGFHLTALKYNAETMHSLVAAFGTIEHFGAFSFASDEGVQDDGMSEQDRIHPHDAPRSANMATEIWEVKWRHREDCVAALMTLRRIPHITVTWAHQQLNILNGSGSESRLSSPNVTPVPRLAPFHSPSRARTHLQSYNLNSPSEYHRINTIRTSFSQDCALEIPPVPFKVLPSIPQHTSTQSSVQEPGLFSHHSPLALVSQPSFGDRRHGAPEEDVVNDARSVGPKWSDSDFPPLHSPRNFTDLDIQQDCIDSHPRSDGASEPAASPSPSSSLSVQPATPYLADETSGVSDQEPREEGVSSLPGSGLGVLQQDESDVGQDVTVPPTPEHSLSTLTPVTPSSMQSYPLTPQSVSHAADSVEVVDVFHTSPYNSTPRKTSTQDDARLRHQPGAPKHFDPFTIFVGGLDMYGTTSWDEIKLRSIFGKYGEIEDVQIVRPLAKRSAFAFIRYKAPEAGARAVAGEHNRTHNGHQIRVQLRENNPARSPWKFARSRGRMSLDALEHGEQALSATSSQSPVRAPESQTYSQKQPSAHGPTAGSQFPGIPEAANGSVGWNPYAFPTTAHSLPSPETPSVSRDRVSHYPLRADSASTTATSVSPSPSTLGHSQTYMPSNVAHYSLPVNMGYYSNQWMQTYPPYHPYAFPLMPHGYMAGPQAPYSSAQEGNSHASASHAGQWITVSDAHKNQPNTTTRGQSPLHAYPAHTSQPPLRPTGFMQGEQGTLIPVYQPDALNRYMSSGSGRTDTPPAAPLTQHQQSPTVWTQHPQMSMYPYVYYHHPPSMLPPPSHQLPMPNAVASQSASWNVTPAQPYGAFQAQYPPPPPPQSFIPSSSSTASASGNFRHSVAGHGQISSHQYGGFRQTGTPGRRYQRREVQWK